MDAVFVPFHRSGASCADALTEAVTDPVSRIPDHEARAVRLERAPASAGVEAGVPTSAAP